LGPLALGHLASVGLIAGAVALAPALERTWTWLLQAAALLWLLGWTVRSLRRRPLRPHGQLGPLGPRGGLGLALWSFIMATTHGAGLMLVPALVPLCLSAAPAREITASGSLALAVLAVAVHLAAMLAVTLAMARGAQRLGRFLRRG